MTAPATPAGRAPALCASCGTELSPALLACPQCRALVHAVRLRALADDAAKATAERDDLRALALWRDALVLLPEGTQQHGVIARRVDDLSRRVSFAPETVGKGVSATRASSDGSSDAPAAKGHRGAWTALVAIGVLVLSKGKLLLLGLSKLSTVSSMLVFLGVYWGLYGWRFALGFVVCIYIHEMGHVAALARYGIKAEMPMFIPGIGAYVRGTHAPANVHEHARVALAGPLWGLAAALTAWGIDKATDAPIWMAIAHTAAWLNLLNLIPVWQLDGGHAFTALSRPQRWLALGFVIAAWAWSRNPTLILLALGGAWAAFQPSSDEPDWGVFGGFTGLVLWLSVLMQTTALPTAGPG